MATFNIEKIRRRAISLFPKLSSILLEGNVKVVDNVKTAETDGVKVAFNKKYIEQFDEDRQTFIMAHEGLHILNDDVLKGEGKQSKLWGVATDAVHNQTILEKGLPIAGNGINFPWVKGLTAEQVYGKLLAKEHGIELTAAQMKHIRDTHVNWPSYIEKLKIAKQRKQSGIDNAIGLGK